MGDGPLIAIPYAYALDTLRLLEAEAEADIFGLLVRGPAVFEARIKKINRIIGRTWLQDTGGRHAAVDESGCLDLIGLPLRILQMYAADLKTGIGFEVDGEGLFLKTLNSPIMFVKLSINV